MGINDLYTSIGKKKVGRKTYFFLYQCPVLMIEIPYLYLLNSDFLSISLEVVYPRTRASASPAMYLHDDARR